MGLKPTVVRHSAIDLKGLPFNYFDGPHGSNTNLVQRDKTKCRKENIFLIKKNQWALCALVGFYCLCI